MKPKRLLTAFLLLLSILTLILPKIASASGKIHWESLGAAIKHNKTDKKYFLVHFYYPTCVYCIRMDKHVFTNKDFISYVNKHFHPVMVDIYSNKTMEYFNGKRMSGSQIAALFHVTGVPHDIFFSPSYKKIFVLPGYWNVKDFLLVAKWVGSGKYKVETLRKFAGPAQ